MFDVCKLCHFPCESSIWKWLTFPFHEEFGKDLIGMSDIVKMVKNYYEKIYTKEAAYAASTSKWFSKIYLMNNLTFVRRECL